MISHIPSNVSRASRASGATPGGRCCGWSTGVSIFGGTDSASVTVLVSGSPAARPTGIETPSLKSSSTDGSSACTASVTAGVLSMPSLKSSSTDWSPACTASVTAGVLSLAVVGVSGSHTAVLSIGKLESTGDVFWSVGGPNGTSRAMSTSRWSLKASVLL